MPTNIAIGMPTGGEVRLSYMQPWAKRIASRLAELEPQGKSRAGLIAACGVKPSSVSGWFGLGTKPTLMIEGGNLVAAAQYLETTAEWIITGRDALSQDQRPTADMLQDAMGYLDELDEILGRKKSPRPDPKRLEIALAAVIDGPLVEGKPVVVRIADRFRELEKERGNDQRSAEGAGQANGSSNGDAGTQAPRPARGRRG